MLPNFIIVGAMKGGTTSLAHMLRRHPDIYMPKREVHFFDKPDYRGGAAAYATRFTGRQQELAIGEKTPTYSHHPAVAVRIAQLLPEVKIIWILREPVARAYSHYWFFVSMGKERLSFEAALEREERGQTRDYTMRYRDRSNYVKQIQRYLKHFSKEQMLFLLFEEFVQQPDMVLARTCRFLGVDDSFAFPQRPARRNITTRPRSTTLQWLAFHLFNKRGARVLRQVKRWNRRREPGYPPMNLDTQRELQSFFRPLNRKLASMTGLDLALWSYNKPQPSSSAPVR